MKRIIYIIVLVFIGITSYGQSSCSCDEFFGSCTVICPGGTSAKCKGTWYGSCSCECIQLVTPGGQTLNTYEIDLNEIFEMKNIFDKTQNIAVGELTDKSENYLYITQDADEYFKYFNRLRNLFFTLSEDYMYELVTNIEKLKS